MKLIRLAPILLAVLLSPALADEYQDAVSKAFPGFQILGPSEIKLNKAEMNPKTYEQVKDHPGLVMGKINSDDITDFAALIRADKRKTYIHKDRDKIVAKFDYYDGYLVVCYGLGSGKYKCEKLNASPMYIREPHSDFVGKIPPARVFCSILRKFRPPKPKPDPNLGEEAGESSVQISFNTDAVSLSSDPIIYIYQPGGTYLECTMGG